MQIPESNIIILIIVITSLLLLLAVFIVSMLFIYQKKQIAYQNNIDAIRSEYEKALLKTQLEIQEQTFQNLSRDIHDNINLSLILAKLNLNTMNPDHKEKSSEQVNNSIELITKAITDLTGISRSMNSELISEQGLISALEQETEKLKKLNWFEILFEVSGSPVYMDAQKELFIFRIVQEAFNNILKHARAKNICLNLFYGTDQVTAIIRDDGVGFPVETDHNNGSMNGSAGLKNMRKRAELINGKCVVNSQPGSGTTITITVPF